MDPSLAHLADDARPRVEEVLDRVGLDAEEVPKTILDRLAGRTRHPEMRLSVGRYLVVGELGRGGMGVVYEAWDPGIDRGVAIKTIEPDLVPEEEREEVIERFKREVKIVGRLHHPAIVTIHDSGLERERDPITNRRVPTLYYYVMEYLEGRSLARVLREKRRLSDEIAVAIAADISEALQLSHDAGVIHRDIKPSNIFLRNDRDAVLLDFGIAKTGSVALTRQGQILGTPSYLAPERLREKEVAIDGRADIFSLGVLLFTMLTGEAPFVGDDVYEVIDKIAKASHPKLGRDTPSGQALSQVIDRMLAKNPSERYATAGEAALALRHVQTLFGLPNSTRPPSLEAEETSDRQATNPSAPTPMAPPRAPSPSGEDVDTGRLELETPKRPAMSLPADTTTADRPPPSRGAPPAAATIPTDPPPETELLEDVVLGPDGVPLVDTKVSPPPPPRMDSTDQDTEDPASEAPVEPQPPPASDPVRVADVLGTRPELALQRETRELMPGGDPQIADLIAEELLEPQIEDTSPSLEMPVVKTTVDAERDTEEREAYEDHAEHNDEATDDETIAEPNRVPESIRNAPLRAHQADQATEQLVRAHGARRGRKRSSRIEASLVDEDDVIVKPAPLEALKPDELPTQTGFQLPTDDPDAEVIATSAGAGDVVRARGDSRVKDPAEAAREDDPKGGATTGGPVAGGREIELDPGSGPGPELDVPRSAAVARRTFGTARARGPSRRAAVQVKVSGNPLSTSADERTRLIRRRGIMLLTATLASVGIGLFLGRMKQPTSDSTEIDVARPKPPKVEPRVSAVKRIPGTNELDLVRPRPPIELIRDAEAARAANHFADAARLYGSAARAVGVGHDLHAQALLGQADALRDQGKNGGAIALYRDVRRLYPRGVEAEKAKLVLTSLGALRPRRVKEVVPSPAPPPRKVEEVAPQKSEPKRTALTDDMSPEQKCITILRNNIDNPRRAVRELEKMETKHPRAPCVFWNLGRKYENLDDLRAALDAYRKYLKLNPRSQKRAAVEGKITNLEAKLRQR